MLIASQGIPSYGIASLSSVKWLLLLVSCCLTHLPLASACVIIRFYWVLSDSSGRRGGSIGIDMDSASVLSSLSSRFGCASMFQLKLSLSASHSSSRIPHFWLSIELTTRHSSFTSFAAVNRAYAIRIKAFPQKFVYSFSSLGFSHFGESITQYISRNGTIVQHYGILIKIWV